MEETTGNSTYVFSENKLQEDLTKQFYTKKEVDAILAPIHSYLEILSETYGIQLSNGLTVYYKIPRPHTSIN